MIAKLLGFVVALAVLVLAGGAAAQDEPPSAASLTEEKAAHLQKLLAESWLDSKDLPEGASLAEFLAAMAGRLPKDKKIALRIDEQAFGKESRKIAEALVSLPRFEKVSFQTVLRLALAQVVKQVGEVDYAFHPDGIVITRPHLAAHTALYSVREAAEQVPRLLPQLKEMDAVTFADLTPTDGPALLVRWLTSSWEVRPWETVEIHNGTRLAVRASPLRHEQIAELLEVLRRLADVAVVMNARLYEVDRAFYVKQIAPLFARDKDPDRRPAVIPIAAPLFKSIARLKPLLETEDVKIRPTQTMVFLSHFSVFRFVADPQPVKEDRADVRKGMVGAATGTGLTGVSFTVRPLVSADRRSLRLRITQDVSQLVGIDKSKKLNVATGKEVEVESPNVRKTSVTGTVQIPDGGRILMPVDYRPPGKGNEDKVWLLVARPLIWIEAEVEIIRKGGEDLSPRSIWNSDVPEDDRPIPKKPLPFNDDVREVLQALVTDVLTNPKLKDTREFYGTARDKTFALVDEGNWGRPAKFEPETHGFKPVQPNRFVNQRRILGIRLDKFDLAQKESDLFNTPIEVCLFNAGGSANGAVIGGCTAHYVPKRVGQRWGVELTQIIDP